MTRRRGAHAVFAGGCLALAVGLVSCTPAVIGRVALSRSEDGAVIAVAALCEGTLTNIDMVSINSSGAYEPEAEWEGDVSDIGITEIRLMASDWTASSLEIYHVSGHGMEPWGLLGRPGANLLGRVDIDGVTLSVIEPGFVLGMDAAHQQTKLLSYDEFWETSCPSAE